MTKLSDTQRVILSAAAQHEMGLARAPKTLPAAARNAPLQPSELPAGGNVAPPPPPLVATDTHRPRGWLAPRSGWLR